MVSFDNKPAIKVFSKGSEENYTREMREQSQNKLIGYKDQDTIQILSSKSEDKSMINVLVANWNINPNENRYDSYDIIVKGVLDGEHDYKIFVIDKDHTFPDRCEKCPWWDVEFKNQMPQKIQERMDELDDRCDELKAIYCPDRANDKSIRYEDELGVAEEGTTESKNGEINLKISGVQSSSVYLIELSKI